MEKNTRVVSVKEFLELTKIYHSKVSVELVKNINNGKFSVEIDGGAYRFKAQGNLSLSKPIKVLYTPGLEEEACFTNNAEFESVGSITL